MDGTWNKDFPVVKGGRTVALTNTGDVKVSIGPSYKILNVNSDNEWVKYRFLGSNNYLLLLKSGKGGGKVDQKVAVVVFESKGDTTIVKEIKHLFTGASNQEPVVSHSNGTGTLFLIYLPDGVDITHLSVRRSDNGEVLPDPCSIPSFSSGGFAFAKATADEVVITYQIKGEAGQKEKPCKLPTGECKVSPDKLDFKDAIIGGAPGLASSTEEFKIKNVGKGCLPVEKIGAAGPFSVTSFAPDNLAQSESITVEVTFKPNVVKKYKEELPITPTPAKGDKALVCVGEARLAKIKIGFNSKSLDFGTVPVGEPVTKTLTIKNLGEKDITVSVSGSPPPAPFQWQGLDDQVIPYKDERQIKITFDPPPPMPPPEQEFKKTLSVVSEDPDSPHSITLKGKVCVPEAAIDVPTVAPIDFGRIQRGFRTVRYIVVENIGYGPLTFTARIAGLDKELYGLQPPSGSLYDVEDERDYHVDPVHPCGKSVVAGTGEAIVAVAFHANDAPRITSADLIIEDHNATNTDKASWTYPLPAEIIALEEVDAALVLDHSHSMSEAAGDRFKTEAEVSAGRLFVQLARPDVEDRMAFVKFSTDPVVVQKIIEITKASQTDLYDKVNGGILAPLFTTNIAGGVYVGLKELAVPRPKKPKKLNKAMMVLSDGKDNTAYENPDDGQWYSLMGGKSRHPVQKNDIDTKPVVVPSDVKVYAVCIGNEENTEKGHLDILAQATGGAYGVVNELSGKNYFNLEKYFVQAYMAIVGKSYLKDPVFTILSGQEHTIEFNVLRGDVDVLVVIFDRLGMRLPFHLVSPQGELIDASLIVPGYQLRSGATEMARFMEFVLPQGEPERYAGVWTVVVAHPGQVCAGDPTNGGAGPTKWGFLPANCREYDGPVDYGVSIGVGSNFRMQPYVTPGIVHMGDPILLTAVVTEAGLPVTGCHVTVKAVSPGGTTWDLKLLDDGIHEDGDPDDGEYARPFTKTAEGGTYEFTFRATGFNRDGEPVTREAVRAKYVEGRLPIGPERGIGVSSDQQIQAFTPFTFIRNAFRRLFFQS
jgi:hypothetical protein